MDSKRLLGVVDAVRDAQSTGPATTCEIARKLGVHDDDKLRCDLDRLVMAGLLERGLLYVRANPGLPFRLARITYQAIHAPVACCGRSHHDLEKLLDRTARRRLAPPCPLWPPKTALAGAPTRAAS